jgi:hypothetical protein
VKARHLGDFRLLLRFSDGLEGEVDLRDELWGEVFEPLRDPAYFARFEVDDTLVWPNGADFAPEFLHERAKVGAARTRGRGARWAFRSRQGRGSPGDGPRRTALSRSSRAQAPAQSSA